ncbi:MAG: hypothetical protein MRY63_00410 [Neomegalonema sp.]|nr:hypothetical protein [Neomegalonema sp.]
MTTLLAVLDTAFGILPTALQAGMMIVTAASAVTALTPTPNDDQIVGKLYKVLEILALNIGRAKDQPANRAQ